MSILRLFYPFVIRDLLSSWRRTAITVTGIALGVCVFLAISLANETALSEFKETVDLVSGKANLEIRPAAGNYIDHSILSTLAPLGREGVVYTPLLQAHAVAVGGKNPLVQINGIDTLAPTEFVQTKTDNSDQEESAASKDARLSTKSDQERSASKTSLLEFGTALIGEKLAEDLKLGKGSELALSVNDKIVKLNVIGVLKSKGLGKSFNGQVVVVDMETAQDLLDLPGKITQVELIVPEGVYQAVQEHLSSNILQPVTVDTPSARARTVEKMTRSFQYNLTALAFIALIVGMFLIYNTMTISIVRRREEIGILRTLGANKLKIAGLFFAEALFFGMAGSLLGVVAGVVLSDSALTAIAGTIEHFYFSHPLGSTTIDPVTLLKAFAIGVALTIIASIPPILEATSVAPAEAARKGSYESRIVHSTRGLFLAGIVIYVLGAIATLGKPIAGFPFFGYAAAFAAIIGTALTTPFALNLAFTAVNKSKSIKSLLGVEGTISLRALGGAPGRTAVAVASLMVGISMMISLAIMISSFRSTVVAWVEQTLKADLYIQSQSRAEGNREGKIDSKTADLIRGVPGVAAVDGFVEHRTMVNGEPVLIGAGEFDVLKKYGRLRLVNGEKGSALKEAMDSNDCVISETFSVRRGISTGDTIEIPTLQGLLPLKVAGIYYDYSSDLGYIIIDRKQYLKNFSDTKLTSIAVFLAPGADAESVRNDCIAKLKGTSLVLIRNNQELRTEAMRVFDRTFSVTYALHTIAIAVALLSVMNALLALTHESRREFAILRYLGATRAQLRKVVLSQAVILGACGSIAGIGVGYVLSLLLVNVINRQSFGWTIQMMIPWDFILQSCGLVIIAALAAGILPANEAGRTKAAEFVRSE
ncbi:MAG: ABC transporter permease [Candidatus Obscuribacterales bacterium]|nr:ABC transporter permease [Candidatus Obscuribacterales bacterium]